MTMHSKSVLKNQQPPAAAIASAPKKLFRRLRRDGVAETWKRACYKAHTAWCEWRLGLRTEAFIDRRNITCDPCAVDYEPTTYSALSRVFSVVGKDLHNKTLLDYGAGMGRVLAFAGRLGFRKVIGVELSETLCADARQNLRTARGLNCEWEVIAADASQYEVPSDVNVVFLFNPFCGQVLEQALDQLHESHRRSPRKTTVLYLQPIADENQLDQRDWLVPRSREIIDGARFVVYDIEL